ncbi:MAG: DUF2510 domain-containing protein [Propionibacteriaceae bacterium]|nr:DUF2510 domain-containing protein [Propionibacteriaceae bacterium]
MSVPGWYPDPDNAGQERFWSGSSWTSQTRSTAPTGSSRPAIAAPTAPTPRSNVLLWGALGLAAAAMIGGGWWLVAGQGRPIAQSAPSSTPPPTSEVLPSRQAPTETTRVQPEAVTTGTPDFSGVAVGDHISAIPGCPITADDAIGEVSDDGRVYSAGGLSFPMIEGFTPRPIKYGFIHQGNSIVKDYTDLGWGAAVTVGTLQPAEGFAEVTPSAARAIGCLLTQGSLYPDGSAAEVVDISYREDLQAGWLDVRIPVSGVAEVTADYVSVATILRDGVMHIALVITPDHDQPGYDLVWKSLEQLELN